MQPWGRQREVERVKQVSVASLPEAQQKAAMSENDVASERFPSVLVADGACSVHVFQGGGEWLVWLNNQDHDFTGLCLAVGKKRDAAVAEAVRILEAATDQLQQPPAAGPKEG